MKKLGVSLALSLALLTGGAAAAGSTATGPVVVNGQAIEAYAKVYHNTTYVSLRSVSEALCPEGVVTWEKGRAVVRTGDTVLTARPGDFYIEADGKAYAVTGGVRAEGGRVLVPVRVLAAALGGTVDWNAKTGVVSVTGGKVDCAESYDADTVYWLSRIISAESSGEPLEGKIAVGNVVLNRVNHADFPNTVYGVIFDDRWGGQFEPVRNGAIYNEPTEESVLAAKLCLDGVNTVGNSLYFIAPDLASNHWVMNNRTFVTTIGCHWFYR